MKTKKFNIEDADHIFNKLKVFCDNDEVKEWEEKVPVDIDYYFDKYRVCKYKINSNSYMGIVLDCKLFSGESIFLKVVPPMINRFLNEVETLKRLPKEVTCKLYEIDYQRNIIIMEKIMPGILAEFDKNKENFLKLFDTLYENRIGIDNFIDNSLKSFDEVVTHDYNILVKTNKNSKDIEKLYNSFLEKYDNIKKSNDSYLLHGDVYKNNVLVSEKGLKVIDPLGFKAPFVMELVSICAYELFNNKKNVQNKKIVSKFVDFFSSFVDYDTYIDALFCQLVKVYIPSIFEANDNGVRASKWLLIIKDLYNVERKV